METNKPFALFASCLPVKGQSRSLICDLARRSFDVIPESLYHILIQDIHTSIQQIIEKYGQEHKAVILEYFQFLVDNDYVFFGQPQELLHFPPLDLTWKSPYTINSAIYDYSPSNKDYSTKIIQELDHLACPNLQIRCFVPWMVNDWAFLVKALHNTRIKNVELILPYQSQIGALKAVINSCKHIYSVGFFDAPFEKVEELYSARILYNTNTITAKSCGLIAPDFFAVNIPTFTESQHHNTCLNRKVSIDSEGNIKNCPSMAQSFGHISTTSLASVLENPEFTQWWHIKKDEINKCQSCEFRHICTDCRAYLEDPNDVYSAPLKCGYNPETCEWEDWSTHPLKQEAIQHYQFTHQTL